MTTDRRKRIRNSVLALVALVVVYLLFWPVPVDPVAWTPPPMPPLEGAYAANTRLEAAERLSPGIGTGPEDVAIDREGRIYGSLDDGRIVRLQPDGTHPETFADTGGRPAGLRFDAGGNLLVCDCDKGLLSIAPDGRVATLATEAAGIPIRFADDLDIAADGTVYFSDASTKFGFRDLILDVVEHRPNGRLLAYDPKTGETRVLLDGLYFANGIAVSPDQTYLLVAETNAYSVRRYWLAGPRAGQSEPFVENLPGFPDGILWNGRDTYWLALSAPRDPLVDRLMPHPFARKVLVRLPAFLVPGPKPASCVLGLDADGRVTENLQDPAGKGFANVTNVVEHDGMLYLGSLSEHAIGRIPAP